MLSAEKHLTDDPGHIWKILRFAQDDISDQRSSSSASRVRLRVTSEPVTGTPVNRPVRPATRRRPDWLFRPGVVPRYGSMKVTAVPQVFLALAYSPSTHTLLASVGSAATPG